MTRVEVLSAARAAGSGLCWRDIDLTVDEDALIDLAEHAGFDIFIDYEGDSLSSTPCSTNGVGDARSAAITWQRERWIRELPGYARTPSGRII
jgi:hypothetical protein